MVRSMLMTAGTALVAVGVVAAAPAKAGTFTYSVSGSASADVEINDIFAGQTLGGFVVPGNASLEVNDFSAIVTLLDDPAQFLDGDITLDYGLVSSWLDDSYETIINSYFAGFGITPTQALEVADDIFDITNFSTTVAIFGDASATTSFDISYDNGANAFSITGYDLSVVEACVVSTCDFSVAVDYGIELNVGEFLDFSTTLLDSQVLPENFATGLTQVRNGLALAQIFGLNSLELASISADLDITTTLVGADANGTEADIALVVSDGTVVGSIDGEPILTQSLDEAVSLLPEIVDVVDAEIPIAQLPTVPETIVSNNVETNDAPQSVPEPGLLLGLLGTGAWMTKRITKLNRTI